MSNPSEDARSTAQPTKPQQTQSTDIPVTLSPAEHREIMQALHPAEHRAQKLAETPGALSTTIHAAREAVKTIQSAQEKLRRAYLAVLNEN